MVYFVLFNMKDHKCFTNACTNFGHFWEVKESLFFKRKAQKLTNKNCCTLNAEQGAANVTVF